MKHIYLLSFSFIFLSTLSYSQEESAEGSSQEEYVDTNLIEHTFEGTRIINGHSIETLRKGVLEFRVEHRFGDIGGADGGVQNLYGFDNSSDIRIAFEYGVTDDFMLGLGRSKGTGAPYKSLLDGFAKYKLLKQKKGGSPVTIAALGTTSFTYMKQSTDVTSVSSFPKWQHRFAYCAQLNIAKKFGENFSFALMPTLVHRNYVQNTDQNTLFSMGGASRIAINSKMAILLEYYYVMADKNLRTTNTNSLGIAFEWITFGHNFTVNITNSKGFGETQFIPYTFEKWNKGQFRLGFTIGRKFESE
ncbi:MAG: DUF5777 family beta-barrel protein [Flavobacteriia bacterium]